MLFKENRWTAGKSNKFNNKKKKTTEGKQMIKYVNKLLKFKKSI